MILEFKVENYRSFKETQILSFEAATSKLAEEFYCVTIKPGVRVLKLGVIYGPNASGKSNVLVALDFLRDTVLKPKPNKTSKTGFIPFLLDKEYSKSPGKFEISFYIDDYKYIYKLIINENEILEEKLVFYSSVQPTEIYTRLMHEGNTLIKYGGKFKTKLKDWEKGILLGNTLPNMTVISAFAKSNIKFIEVEKVYKYFLDSFTSLISPKTDLSLFASDRMEKSPATKNTIIEMLNKADFNISNIIFNKNETDEIFDNNSFHESGKQIKMYFEHNVTKNFINEIYNLPIELQSAGTIRFLGLGSLLVDVFANDLFIPIDELENSLHPDLFMHFINTFLVNSRKSQLIFTTHNASFLDLDDLRKDVIWFTNKKSSGATELYSLEEFDIRKELSYLNAYNAGKFSAKPNIPGIYTNNSNE